MNLSRVSNPPKIRLQLDAAGLNLVTLIKILSVTYPI